jgi:hypothetical protein
MRVTDPFIEGGCDFLKAPTTLTCTASPENEILRLSIEYTLEKAVVEKLSVRTLKAAQ